MRMVGKASGRSQRTSGKTKSTIVRLGERAKRDWIVIYLGGHAIGVIYSRTGEKGKVCKFCGDAHSLREGGGALNANDYVNKPVHVAMTHSRGL